MLDTILSWIYTVLNWFRSPLRQIPTQTTNPHDMDSRSDDRATAEQPQHREGVITTHEYDGGSLVRRLPGDLPAATRDNDDDIHLDDPPKQVLDPVLSVGGPSTVDGLPHTITSSEPGPFMPDDDTAMKLEMPTDPATLAARSEELNKDNSDDAADAVAPPPSAAAVDLPGGAAELVKAPPGPIIVPEELASKLELGQTSGKGDDGSGKGGGGQETETEAERKGERKEEKEHEM